MIYFSGFLFLIGLVASASAFVTRMLYFTGDAKKAFTQLNSTLESINATIGRTVGRGSALQLTKLGEEIAKQIDAKTLAEWIVLSIDEENFNLPPYDLQQFCFNYVKNELQLEQRDEEQLKNCSYENGIELDQVLDVLALAIRDEMTKTATEVKGLCEMNKYCAGYGVFDTEKARSHNLAPDIFDESELMYELDHGATWIRQSVNRRGSYVLELYTIEEAATLFTERGIEVPNSLAIKISQR